MNVLEDIANSLYLSEIPFQQKNTTFQDFLTDHAINSLRLNAKHKIEKNDNPEFPLQVLYEDKRYLLAIKLKEIKKPSEYKKILKSQIKNQDINGAIVITSLALNKTISSHLKKFPVEIKVIDYLQASNVQRYSPIAGTQIRIESPKGELLELSRQLEYSIRNFEGKTISRKRLYKATEILQSRLRFLDGGEKYYQILDTAYRLLTKKGKNKPVQIKKSNGINLAKLIGSEKVTLTDKILIFNEQMQENNPNYFIFWKMQGKKTLFEKGIIILVDNERAEESFREALEKKYELEIHSTKQIDYLIKDRIEKARKFQYRSK